MPSELPSGGIARGSIFSIFGANLGPGEPAAVSQFPLQDNLAGVRVTVSSAGGPTLSAFPLYVSSTQINAIMPSDAPLGDAVVQIEFDDDDGGEFSVPVNVRVVESSFGAFSVNSSGSGPAAALNFIAENEQPLNTPGTAAQPGQYVTLWGTGLGAADGPDDLPPGAAGVRDRTAALGLSVVVGGMPSEVLYAGRSPEFAGVDQVTFKVPDNAPLGCFVPLAVTLGDTVSNFTTIAVSTQPGRCEDGLNPHAASEEATPAAGILLLSQLLFDSNEGVYVDDFGTALFGRLEPRDSFFSPSLNMPPLGTCTSLSERNTAGGLPIPALPGGLDAGSPTVQGPIGERPLSALVPGLYQSSLASGSPTAAFLQDGRQYVVGATGGADVGPFQASATFSTLPQWSIVGGPEVARSEAVTLSWQGPSPANSYVWVLGVVADSVSLGQNVTITFLCTSDPANAEITIPVETLANLPISVGVGASSTAVVWLGWSSLPSVNDFETSGLDVLRLTLLSLRGQPIQTF